MDKKLQRKEVWRDYSKTIFQRIIKLLIFFLLCQLYQCPIRYYLGMECPGCGTTRAIKAALSFDFETAFSSHFLFLVPVICGFYYTFREKIFVGKQILI